MIDPSNPADLPDTELCIGCGATLRVLRGAPGTRAMFHPAPLCERLLSKLRAIGHSPPLDGGYLVTDSARGGN